MTLNQLSCRNIFDVLVVICYQLFRRFRRRVTEEMYAEVIAKEVLPSPEDSSVLITFRLIQYVCIIAVALSYRIILVLGGISCYEY